MNQSENVRATGKIRLLKLKRETLRELDAGELKQAQGGGTRRTEYCSTERACGPQKTKRCATARAC